MPDSCLNFGMMTVLKCSSKAGMNEFSCWKVIAVTLPPAGFAAAAPVWPGTTRSTGGAAADWACVGAAAAAGAAGLAASVGLASAGLAAGDPDDPHAASVRKRRRDTSRPDTSDMRALLAT